jgi:hypothetical protein
MPHVENAPALTSVQSDAVPTCTGVPIGAEVVVPS